MVFRALWVTVAVLSMNKAETFFKKKTNKQTKKKNKKEQKHLKRSSQTMLTQRETRMTEDGEDW